MAAERTEEFDAIEFVEYLRFRRRFLLLCCGSALLLTLSVSFLLPRRYTATASILIGSPAGMDPRGATSVSPVYLESLRTYEHVASSDSLFIHSLEHLGIRQQYAGRTIESLKRSVLKVSKPVNTRVIEISATLEDPQKAQALAQYIAEQTVELSRSLDSRFSQDVAKEAASIFEKSGDRLKGAQQAAEQAAKIPATDALAAALANARDLKLRVDGDLLTARADLAELASRSSGEAAAAQPSNQDVAGAKARIADLEGQAQKLAETLLAAGSQLETQKQRHESVDAELKAARSDFESAGRKLSDIRAAAAFRGERLDMFDAGIVPQRPSSPNILLNVLAALLFSLIASLAFLTFQFGYERARRRHRERAWSLR